MFRDRVNLTRIRVVRMVDQIVAMVMLTNATSLETASRQRRRVVSVRDNVEDHGTIVVFMLGNDRDSVCPHRVMGMGFYRNIGLVVVTVSMRGSVRFHTATRHLMGMRINRDSHRLLIGIVSCMSMRRNGFDRVIPSTGMGVLRDRDINIVYSVIIEIRIR